MPVQDRSDVSIDEWTLNINVLGPNTIQARNIMFGLADAVNEAPQPATPILPRRGRGRPSRRELEIRNGGAATPQTPPANEMRNLQQQIQEQVQQQLQQHLVQLQQPARQEVQVQGPITGIRCGLCRQLTADTVINPCNHTVCSGCVPRLISCPSCNRAILPANLIRMRP